MTDPVAPFRSNKSVPDRVDDAWFRGYNAGHASFLRWCGLAAVVAVFRFLRAHRLPPFVVGFLTTLFALVVIPCAVLIFTATLIYRRRTRRPVTQVVQLENGEVF